MFGKKIKIIIPLLAVILIAAILVYWRQQEKQGCFNYQLDEQYLIFNRNNEPRAVSDVMRSPRNNEPLEEIILDFNYNDQEIKRRAYYDDQENIFWILDLAIDYTQWFGPYKGHPCDQPQF